MAQVVWYPQSLETQAGLDVRIGGIGTVSLNNAYEHAERSLSKGEQQQEKPNKTNLGQAHTRFTAHTALDEELVLTLWPCTRAGNRLQMQQTALAESETDPVCSVCNHDYTTQRPQMHEEQTKGTAQVSHRRMQLAKNSLTSQREDTAAEQRTHAWLEDLPGAIQAAKICSTARPGGTAYNKTAFWSTAPRSETTQTSA